MGIITGGIASEVRSADEMLGNGWGRITTMGLDKDLEFVEVANESEFFDRYPEVADALVTSAEAGSAWTLRHPNFIVVKPDELDTRSPLYYLVPETSRFADLVNGWLKLRRRDGSIQQLYDYWILGQDDRDPAPRWCIVRDVLRWIE